MDGRRPPTGVSAAIAPAAEALFGAICHSVVSLQSAAGHAAGVVWTADGVIVTANHAVPETDVTVETVDGRRRQGVVVARHPRLDLALVHVAATLAALSHERPAPPRPGSLVFAVGHPWGERWAVTAGIILSGAASDGLIRADIRLAPGNSGGPLVDCQGRIAGINVMIAGGAAVAIPATAADALIRDARGGAVDLAGAPATAGLRSDGTREWA